MEFLNLVSWKDNNNIAFCCDNEIISYGNLLNDIIKMKNSNKLENYKNIAIYLPNSIDYCRVFLSLIIAGKRVFLLNYAYTYSEVRQLVVENGIECVITNSEKKGLLEIIQPVMYVDKIGMQDQNFDLLNTELLKQNEASIVIFTSGTTAKSKGVELTIVNIINNIESYKKVIKYRGDEKALVTVPLTSSYGNFMLCAYLRMGVTVKFLTQSGALKNIIVSLQKDKITHLITIPTVLNLLMKMEKKLEVENLKFIGFSGSTISGKVIQELIEKFNDVSIVQGYGMTEAGPVIAMMDEDNYKTKIGSVGKALPNQTVMIACDNKYSKTPWKEGEIVVSGLNVMKGYYNNQVSTSKVLYDGYLHTGDIGYLDSEGYLYIKGRIKNLIITGGYNVSPEEIENVLNLYPGIKESFVYAAKDAVVGEKICAQIVLDSTIEKDFSSNAFLRFCQQNMATYKIPKKIEIVSEIIKTKSGKVKRNYE